MKDERPKQCDCLGFSFRNSFLGTIYSTAKRLIEQSPGLPLRLPWVTASWSQP
jgi:hypothetical protein